MRGTAGLALKLGVSGGLIWLILSRVELSEVGARLAAFPVPAAILVLALSLAQYGVAAERWRAILAALGFTLDRGAALRITAIGLFFNQGLPSTIGGDAFRVYYARLSEVGLGDAIRSVLIDRAAGLAGILLIVAAGLVPMAGMVEDTAPRLALGIFVSVGAAGFGVVLSIRGTLADRLARRRPFKQLVMLSEGARRVFLSRRAAFRVMGASLAIHLLAILKIYVCAVAIGAPLDLLQSLVLVPPVILLSVVPISIAGWGVREAAMVVALGFAGIAPAEAITISLAFGLSLVIMGLPGAVLWLAGGRVRPPVVGAMTAPAVKPRVP